MPRSYSYEVYKNNTRQHYENGLQTKAAAKKSAHEHMLSLPGASNITCAVYRRYADGEWGATTKYKLNNWKLVLIDDLKNIPDTTISSVKNKIAESMAHGMNAREIALELKLFTKPELILVIMNLLVENNQALSKKLIT